MNILPNQGPGICIDFHIFNPKEKYSELVWKERRLICLFSLFYICETAPSALLDMQTHTATNTIVVIIWD